MVLLVLVMGAALLRRQSQPLETQPVALPTTETPPVVASATSPQAVASTTPLPAASTATDGVFDTSRPRRVQINTSEPAVARTPADAASQPGVTR